jgi:hypothetical protein
VDILLAKHGHAVLRDPPYHCEYNPIELIWSITKRIYTKLIRQFKGSVSVDHSIESWEQALSSVDPTAWANAAAHCDKLVMDHYTAEFGENPQTHHLKSIIATLDSSSDSDSSDAEHGQRAHRRLIYENEQAEKKRKYTERCDRLLEEVEFNIAIIIFLLINSANFLQHLERSRKTVYEMAPKSRKATLAEKLISTP